MKLARFAGENGARLGVVVGNQIIPLDSIAAQYPTMVSIVAGGDQALAKVRALAEAGDGAIALDEVSLLAPIERPGKYLAIGMNYGKHLEEADRLGVPRSSHQVWFNKQTTCLTGPYDEIEPGVTEKLDYEVELGVVIGKPAKGVSEADAKNHVFGYFVAI